MHCQQGGTHFFHLVFCNLGSASKCNPVLPRRYPDILILKILQLCGRGHCMALATHGTFSILTAVGDRGSSFNLPSLRPLHSIMSGWIVVILVCSLGITTARAVPPGTTIDKSKYMSLYCEKSITIPGSTGYGT